MDTSSLVSFSLCEGWLYLWHLYAYMYVVAIMMVFFVRAENVLCSGDHVSWHNPLDGSESRVQHMLMTEDAQLQPITTPFGTVSFIQVLIYIVQMVEFVHDELAAYLAFAICLSLI
jgi:hypothetical protein